ncbi:hypothetical protein EJ05DRAFT_525977 [Pseudovirgaria hyperparasitica]|uniref:Uncharacterized protein n=1 Tax=Pseudovirgaria hyperparasitica TaxID=470096 RepID=A0A6A6VPH6_9PEZI|nr:uncharacterized protein EJ05DRAFT_525977 [Pseudovirgaria hyperparasitica]KAF2752522.1 hypothetical protein EJ05DRAFT_525977 [Pseudovirgaria hyperparasitica]
MTENPHDEKQLAYLQLWTFCLRRFTDVTNFTPRKELGHPKPPLSRSNQAVICKLARMAFDLGFRIEFIEEAITEDPMDLLACHLVEGSEILRLKIPENEWRNIAAILRKSGAGTGSVPDAPIFTDHDTQLDVCKSIKGQDHSVVSGMLWRGAQSTGSLLHWAIGVLVRQGVSWQQYCEEDTPSGSLVCKAALGNNMLPRAALPRASMSVPVQDHIALHHI